MTTIPRPTVRSATPDDADAMGALSVRAWRAAYPGVMPQAYLDGLDGAERAAMWRAATTRPDRPGRGVLVAVAEGRVLGFAAWGAEQLDEPDAGPSGAPDGRGELYAINVDPGAWGSGTGQALIAAARDGLAAAGYREAVLWATPSNDRARRFYRCDGWRQDGAERVSDVGGVTVATVRYHRHLP